MVTLKLKCANDLIEELKTKPTPERLGQLLLRCRIARYDAKGQIFRIHILYDVGHPKHSVQKFLRKQKK